MKIVTKAEAIKQGMNYYFTGKPCKYGHIAKRLISSPHCSACKLEKRKAFYAKNIDSQRKKGLENYYQNRDNKILQMRQWQKDNKDSVNARSRKYRSTRREKFNAINKEWRVKNHAYILFKNSLRLKHIKIATPKWANLDKIKKIYEDAFTLSKDKQVKMHVDHIIPLRGKYVCGLHVETNLRIILAEENMRKGNKIDERQ